MDVYFAGGQVFFDFGGQVPADPGHLQQFLVREGIDLLRQSFEVQGCPAVRPDLEDVVPPELLDISNLRENSGNFPVFHVSPLILDKQSLPQTCKVRREVRGISYSLTDSLCGLGVFAAQVFSVNYTVFGDSYR